MKIRQTDDTSDYRDIKKQRRNGDRWMQVLMAILVAGSTALGGTTYLQTQDIASDPQTIGVFTIANAKEMEQRMQHEIETKVSAAAAYDGARWAEIGDKVNRQYETVQTIAKTLQSMAEKCAEGAVRDQVMAQQIKDNRDMLLRHLGATSGGWHGGGRVRPEPEEPP